MAVRFTCPKGHGITANDSMIGKSGKCPQCGSAFVVPASNSSANMSDIIVFLCPNGHKLNGPKSMQGKPGKCPHCGSRFQIPVYDEEELAAAAAGSGPQSPVFTQVDRVQDLGGDSSIGAGSGAATERARHRLCYFLPLLLEPSSASPASVCMAHGRRATPRCVARAGTLSVPDLAPRGSPVRRSTN